MRLSSPRVPPLEPADWNDETAELLERFTRPGADGSPRLLNIFKTLAHNPHLLRRWTVFANHILFKSSLPPRDRELVILRIGWQCKAEYEWGQHVVIGKREGLSSADIEAIAQGPDAPGLNSWDATLLRAADELHGDAMLSDASWSALGERYSNEQLIDLVFTIGQYNLVSMALNTFGVQLDEGIAGFEETVGSTSSE